MQDNTREKSQDIITLLTFLAKKNRLVESILFIFSAVVIVSSIIFAFELSKVPALLLTILGIVIVSYYLFHSELRLITPANMAEHLNRQFPQFEESLHLIYAKKLSPVAKLQLKVVTARLFEANKNNLLEVAISPVKFRYGIGLLIVPVIFFLGFLYASYLSIPKNTIAVDDNTELQSKAELDNVISLSSIHVTPPEYTQLESYSQNTLDLKVVQGAKIQWKFKVNDRLQDYYWIGSDNKPLKMSWKDGFLAFQKEVDSTGFYRIAAKEKDKLNNVTDIHTIEVINDKYPQIKILAPVRSLMEFKKNEETSFSLKALVSDDYKVEEVTIQASVAKGSGEAVKFRDKQFKFTKSETSEYGKIFSKSWSLPELDMEPGDEVYFHVIAIDNKQPIAQKSKSNSIIIRWLDDQVTETSAEGIQIRFVPEYFRSQRQIIIETEQLISDKRDLNQNDFDDKSRDLGHSQSSLKEKYGQYLGDEFGEGSDAMHGLADGYHGGEDVAQGEASAGIDSHDKGHADEGGHNHDIENNSDKGDEHSHSDALIASPSSDKSGASQLIAQFAHNHGTVEVGPMSNRDPKSWMKMAVNEMWQAELHLMLSEPEKALPFEYKAYDYLKLARQAERIYVKRLGFEPPPVKEDSRLTGELSDILNYSLEEVVKPTVDDQSLIIQSAYSMLSTVGTRFKYDGQLNELQIEELTRLSKVLLTLGDERPALIKHAATVEKMIANKNLELDSCNRCVEQLKQKLWQLADKPVSNPNPIEVEQALDSKSFKQYQLLMNQFEQREQQGGVE